ncbi:MAG: hypothetical protein H0X02_03945 [Nitrosomonas sp.]|nr:hypothetical protein [Nitrosomonas sp.]
MSDLAIVLTTGCGTLIALVLWFILFYKNRASRLSTRQLLIIILAVGLICRAAYSILTPTFYAPDEHPHFNYVKYLAETHSLPIRTTQTDEYFQSPLYYLSLTPFYWLSQSLPLKENLIVRLLRFLTVLLWGVTVFFTFKFLERLHIDDTFIKLFVVSMVSLLPTYTYLSSVMNNDNLIMAFGSAILYLAVHPKPSLKNSALIGVLLGFALLTKLTAVIFFPLIALLSLIRFVKESDTRSEVARIFLSLILPILIFAPWGWRTWNIYGSISGLDATVPFEWNYSAFFVIWGDLWYILQSFWAVSGRYNDIPNFFYPIIGKHMLYLALIGLLYGWLCKREKLKLLMGENTNVIIASAFAVLINLLLIFVMLYKQGVGRYLFPLLIPISLLMAIGLRIYSVSDSEDSRIHLTGFFITYALSFTCFTLAMLTKIYR